MARKKSSTWPRTNARRLEGRTFGRLRVLRETERRASNGSIVWECVCECGGRAEVATANLTTGNTTSCGCLQREVSRRPNSERGLAPPEIIQHPPA
jgi:hypothetical protein